MGQQSDTTGERSGAGPTAYRSGHGGETPPTSNLRATLRNYEQKNPPKVIENTKEAEKKARLLFEDAVNKNNVELEKFKQALEKIATQQKKSVEDLAKTLAAESERMLHKLSAGVSAGVEAFTKEFKK
ncbi:hypothetical protein ABMA28_011621 [Loxostege sticticalis]|uniref:Uncharacterized protein n=1 Tax=Loxostege sticticalis TaxID=481309 RepID=A0ABD0S6P3_LOXSC